MRLLIVLSLLIVFSGCAHEPARGSLEYQDRQVYMCRELCAAGTIEVHRIENLQCACAPKQQTPFIYNPVQSTGGHSSREPAGWFTTPVQATPVAQAEPIIKSSAAIFENTQGRTVISQTK